MGDEAVVYLLDDDSADRRSLTTSVKKVFPNVKAFSSATEFLADYQGHQPGCLVLEVVIREMSGLELYQQLMGEKIALPTVFVARHGTVSMAVTAMQLGAVDFLEKPVHEQRLWNSVRKALNMSERNHRRLVRRRQVEERLACLSPGELKVFHLMLEGNMNKEMASKLGLSVRTIEDRRARLMRKMGVNSIAELVQLVMTY